MIGEEEESTSPSGINLVDIRLGVRLRVRVRVRYDDYPRDVYLMTSSMLPPYELGAIVCVLVDLQISDIKSCSVKKSR